MSTTHGQPPSPSSFPPPMSPSTRAAAAAALRRQHKMTLERKVSDHAVSDTPLSTAGPGPNSDEYFGPSAGLASAVTAITANIATTSDRRGPPPGTPGRRQAPARLQPLTLEPLTLGGQERRRRESVTAGRKKVGFEHGRGRGEVSLDGEEAEVERKKQQETLEELKELKKAAET